MMSPLLKFVRYRRLTSSRNMSFEKHDKGSSRANKSKSVHRAFFCLSNFLAFLSGLIEILIDLARTMPSSRWLSVNLGVQTAADFQMPEMRFPK
jgi:hypothetical protein